jgi:tetratricopeptide (TPR) repeat protein
MLSLRRLNSALKRTSSPVRMLVLLLPFTALVLSPVLFADFIRLDDYSHLFDNPHLRRMSVSGLAAFWTKAYFNLYIPITYSVWWAVTMIGSLFGPLRQTAWLFHALNLAVHLANASLVFFVVRALVQRGRQKSANQYTTDGTTVALISALFFALHPVQVETVAWISELKGELSMMFGLLGLWWHTRSRKRVLTAAFFVAAVLSKPSAIVFPGMVLLVDRILLGISLRKSAVMPALYSIPLLPLVFVTKHLQGDSELDFIPTTLQRLAVAADALAFYLYKVLVPYPLAVDYGRSPQYVLHHVPGWRMALSALLLVAGLAVVVKALIRPRSPSPDGDGYALVSCGWSIFLLSIAPVLGLISFGFQEFSTVADHYLYVSLMGVSLMVAGVLIRFAAFTKAHYLAAAVLVVLAGLSFQQARRWRSTESLFTHTVKVNPQSYLGYYSVAAEYMQTGRLDQSIGWLEKSLAVNPNYLNAEIAFGLVWSQRGDYAKAIDHYNSALAKNPSIVGTRAKLVSSVHNNLGMVLLQVGRAEEGIAHFRKAIEIFPRSLNAHLNLGGIAYDEQRYSDAIAEFEIAQSLSPGNPAVEQRLERARQSAHRAPRDDTPQRPSP